MSQGGSSTQSTTQQAPSWLLPYQQYGSNQALAQYKDTSQLVAPFSAPQESAISGINNMAGGTPVTSAAGNYVTNTLNNGPTTNPYLDSLYKQGANQIEQGLDSQFAAAGRNADASLGPQALADSTFASNLYGNAFNTGVQQQENAASMAIPLEQQQAARLQNQFNAGQQVQNLSQQYIHAPQNFLTQYLQRVNGTNASTTTQPMYPFGGSGMMTLGGASLGGSLGSTIGNYFGSGSTGGLLGTLAGGLLGAYG